MTGKQNWKKRKQRLALFLDGTWNNQDDSTNVLHVYSLTLEGVVVDGPDGVVTQKRYYDPGVGTGLDRVTGGGFGLGLETNVRQAYNWLVDHYCDGDEIYVFGFSRGAYTARSLVGFIATCGLVCRGAPLTVSQLWEGYGQIGRERADRRNWWESLAGKRDKPFRRITELKWDSGESRAEPINDTERLLITCSRRVPIRYLGIFDTVGALGWDALAIPGLRSRLAQHHNIYPTKLLGRCQHALAVDENRISFNPTLLLDYVPNDAEPGETDEYVGTIRQRWFVGAHSNIGGGYVDNLLARQPLEWILEGVRSAEAPGPGGQGKRTTSAHQQNGLVTRELPALPRDPKAEDRRDSHAEFAAPLWMHFVRAKRNYRRIDRPDVVRAGRRVPDRRTGYTLRAIEERLDDTVLELAAADSGYAPPHLLAYARRCKDDATRETFANRKPIREWPGSVPARAILVSWCTLAAVGLGVLPQLFLYEYSTLGTLEFAFLGALFLLVDWGEYSTNQYSAEHADAIVPRVVRKLLQFPRLIGVALFLVGAVLFVKLFWTAGWSASNWSAGRQALQSIAISWYLVPLAAVVAMLVADVIDGNFRLRPIVGGAVSAFGALIGTGVLIALAAAGFRHLAGLQIETGAPVESSWAESDRVAGKFLLVLLALLALVGGLKWVGVPMGRSGANLGSITRLQIACTSKRVKQCLDDWTNRLQRNWITESDRRPVAWERVKEVIREALWRDLLGCIPVSTAALGVTMWVGAELEFPSWWSWLATPVLGDIPLWLVLAAITAVADVAENLVHFRLLRHHENGNVPMRVAVSGGLATAIKFAGVIFAGLISFGIFLTLCWVVISDAAGGWRWTLAAAITYLFISALVLVIAVLVRRFYVETMSGKED